MATAHLHIKTHARRHHHSVLFLLIPALVFAFVLALLLQNLPGERVRGATTSVQTEVSEPLTQ